MTGNAQWLASLWEGNTRHKTDIGW